MPLPQLGTDAERDVLLLRLRTTFATYSELLHTLGDNHPVVIAHQREYNVILKQLDQMYDRSKL